MDGCQQPLSDSMGNHARFLQVAGYLLIIIQFVLMVVTGPVACKHVRQRWRHRNGQRQGSSSLLQLNEMQ